ncbi:hypothetical protein EEL32_11670 [Brevibacillus laterosporus]|uniref:Uncharacterized protein n=1 Tax=Brevibacillus laterosporus TaxID=1465 RepID=A0A502IKY2_BRELA|nr:hypothetical protein [Brevibacillus laterosporus]QDX95371.1 hypothetical protein EEL30_25650 [Brevibacillus laterosporus]RAP28556.1 hypothetical protein C2W64_04612 [Brevibacillus laterosporus]TPG69276.1 hypothetical protein EEL31_12575 [Brevibacillus laterosporus]TPG86773.1 hypothetical protein EEL32_11670 [Brevibacillus laterosporus]
MKKIVIALFALMLLLTACDPLRFTEKNPIDQQDMISLLQPKLEKAPTYEKFTHVYAKEAVGGERIATITKDGVETENTAVAKDMLVKNQTEANEMYILKPDKFSKRYKQIGEAKDGFKEYQAVGEIKAIEVTPDLLKEAKVTAQEFYFIAAWGEKMVVKEGDYLVSPLDYSEVYRIAHKEFFETYRLKEKEPDRS